MKPALPPAKGKHMRKLMILRGRLYGFAADWLHAFGDWCHERSKLLMRQADARCARQGNLFTDGRG